MKKLLALVVLTVFACGFGKTAFAVEAARSNSPLSKPDPVMSEDAVPAEPEADTMLDEAAIPEDETVIPSDEATEEDIMAPMEEGEEPVSSDLPKKV